MKRKKRVNLHAEVHLLNDTSPFAIREAFNRLRTNLMYTLNDDEGCPIFAVTSDDAASGKSTIISSVAISYAISGKKVLLIDGDMRAPMQYKLFELSRHQAGLSELLSGIEEDDKNVILPQKTEGLHLLLAGKNPPNPSELIMSQRFANFLQKWRGEFDAIFIDFPPVGIVVDTLAVKDLITGYVFVIRSGFNDSNHIRAALDGMEQVNAKVLGIVFNDVHSKTGGKYKKSYYYSSRYGYGYGSTPKKKSADKPASTEG